MIMHRASLVLFLLILSTGAQAAKYKLDPAHTSVLFKIKHLVISTVTGRFEKFEGTFDFDEKSGKMSNLKVKIQTASINTNEKDRDNHLRTKDFFNAEKNPTITFTSTKITDSKKPKQIKGKLTMNGKTNDLTFDVDFKGTAKDPWGNKIMAFEATAKLDRRKYGLTWNKSLDKGGVLIGNEVKIIIDAEANPVKK